MGVILILGRHEDLCCRLVQEQLSAPMHEIWFLPEDQMLPNLNFAWMPSSIGRQGILGYMGRRVRFSDITGVLCRFHGIPIGAGDFDTSNGRYISAEWNAMLMAWLHQMDCIVVNRLRPELWYKAHLNVPDLVALVPGVRFRLPRALVTTVNDDATSFCRSVSGPVRYSTLSQPARYRIQTEVDRQKLAALEGSLPLYLTEWIGGRALDAFVIGDSVVLVGPDGQLDSAPPTAVSSRCAEVGTALGLAFFRLSLVKTADGGWYCLGLDRFPQLYGCAPEAQTQIAQALARILCAKTGNQ